MTNKTLQRFIKYTTTGIMDPVGLSAYEQQMLLQLILVESTYYNEEEDEKDPCKAVIGD